MFGSSPAGTLAKVAVAVGLAFASVGVQAVPLTLTGDFVQVGISDRGSFGSNGSTAPGIRHDPTGTGNFTPGGIANDYLTPGTPHDGFGIRSASTGWIQNDNTGISGFGSASPTLLAGAAAEGFAHAATWSGSFAGGTITNSYFFNDGDERVLIKTTITATGTETGLTGLSFARSTDPDPDVNRFGDFATRNQRGNALFSAEDFVGSAGAVSGLFLGFLNDSGNTYVHNTRIDNSCCSNIDPAVVLTGGGPIYPAAPSVADFGLNMAWLIGDLAAGASAEIRYFYVFGTNIDTGGGDGRVPEPGTLALLGLGLGLASLAKRRLRRTA